MTRTLAPKPDRSASISRRPDVRAATARPCPHARATIAACALVTLLLFSACKPATPAADGAEAAKAAGAAQRIGDIEIVDPWVRATAPGAPTAGGFVTLRNTGAAADRLVSVSTDAVAEAQIHEMKMDGDVMRMRQLVDGLALPAGGSVALAPGGYHLMLTQPRAPIVAGQTLRMRLTFARAGAVDVAFPVRPMDTVPGGGHAH